MHPDVVVPVKVYVARTNDEIDALVAGKVLTFGTKKVEEAESAEKPAEKAEEAADKKEDAAKTQE